MEICTLASSSSGNCTLISSGATHILIDAGISYKRVKTSLGALGLSVEQLSAVLVTHDHSDHISGLPVLTKYQNVPIVVSRETDNTIETKVASPEKLTRIEPGDDFCVDGLCVRAFHTPHDTFGSVGYRVTDGRSTIVFVTDLGLVTPEVRDSALGADLAIIEANHDIVMLRNGPYPAYLKRRISSPHGHLSNDAGGAFAAELVKSGTKSIILAHLSHENNTPTLAYNAVARAFRNVGAEAGRDATLDVAPRDDIGKMYNIGA